MRKFAKAVMLAGVLAASPAVYANEIDAKDPQKLATLIREWADDVAVGKDSDGDPKITFKYNDLKQALYFYGCTNGKNCTSVQFVLSYDNNDETIEDMNSWNNTKRFASAFLGDDNDPALTMDVILSQKVSRAYMRDVMARWRSISDDFDDYVRK